MLSKQPASSCKPGEWQTGGCEKLTAEEYAAGVALLEARDEPQQRRLACKHIDADVTSPLCRCSLPSTGTLSMPCNLRQEHI